MVWQALVLAVTSNLDDLALGVSFGLRSRRTLPWPTVLTVATLSAITMGAGIWMGSAASVFLPEHLASLLAAVVFGGFGLWFCWCWIRGRRDAASERARSVQPQDGLPGPQGPSEVGSEHVEDRREGGWWSGLWLGLALGIDSLALGVSGGLADYPLVLTAGLAGVTSLGFMWIGSKAGGGFSRVVGTHTDLFAALLLFALALANLRP